MALSYSGRGSVRTHAGLTTPLEPLAWNIWTLIISSIPRWFRRFIATCQPGAFALRYVQCKRA